MIEYCRNPNLGFFIDMNLIDLFVTLQVVNLQAQLACLKEQATQSVMSGASATANTNDRYNGTGKVPSHHHPQDHLQSMFHQMDNSSMFNPNFSHHSTEVSFSGFIDPNSMGNYENSSSVSGDDASFSTLGEMSSLDNMHRQWSFHDSEDLQSVAFGYNTQHSWRDYRIYSWWRRRSCQILMNSCMLHTLE